MTKNDTNILSPRQIKALPVLAAIPNCEEACKKVGISRNCFYEWLKNPLFKEALNKLRNEIVQEAITQLKANSVKAAITLVSLTARTENPSVQRAAANDILNHVMKFKELLEFEERLSELEKRFPPMS